MGKGRRRLTCTGCLIGCGVLVLLLVLTSFGTAYWLTKKGTFQADTTILSDDSEFYAQVDLRAEDELLVDFFSHLAEKANRDNPVYKKFPFLENWSRKKTRKDIEKMLPLKLEFTGRVMTSDFRGSLGFSLYNNAVSLFFGLMTWGMRDEGDAIDFQGRTYLRFVDGTDVLFMSLDESLLYITNTEDGMRALLKIGNRPAASVHGTDPRLAGVDLKHPIYGYLTQDAININWWPQAELSRQEEAAARRMFSSDMFSRVAFSLFLESERRLCIRAIFDVVEGKDDPAIEAWIGALPEQIFGNEALEVESRVDTTADGYTLHITLSGFENLVPTHESISF